MVKLTVRRRIVLLLLLVSLIPLALANLVWLYASQNDLKDAAGRQQTLLGKSSADAVNYFLTNKIDDAIIHSQTASVQNFHLNGAEAELGYYLKQDEDLIRIGLVDASGKQLLQLDRDGASRQVTDVSQSDAFRVVTFLGGSEYLSPVHFDAQRQPQLTIAVPLIEYTNTQGSSSLSTAEPGIVRSPADVKGALVVDVSIKRLWDDVLSNRLGTSGYAYVADDKGRLIAHPQGQFVAAQRDLRAVPEVAAALKQTAAVTAAAATSPPRETISETGVPVLSSHYRIARTNWILVAEEPVSSVYASLRQDVWVAAGFFVASALVGLGLVMLTARSLVRPIRSLAEGASRVGAGDLDYRIELARQDEFGMLARTFNDMAAKLKGDIQQLENVDKLKNEFIMIASHNLRTPLTIIDGSLSVLKSGLLPAQLRPMTDAIEASAHELSAFSEDLLTISSIESGVAAVSPQRITAGEFFAPLRAQYDRLARQKGVALVWQLPEAQTAILASPVHLRSALGNLLGNAIEFTPQGGAVTFGLAVEADTCTFTVADTGAGIEAAEMDKLFTKFHRGTSTLRYDHAGRGIGLYVTRLIVQAHHGEISVESTPGRGSVFTVTLPVGGAAGSAG